MPNEEIQQSLTVHESGGALQAPTMYEVFSQLVRDTTVDPVRIQHFVQLQIQLEERQAEKEFIAAFQRLQPRLPRASKDGTIDMGTKGKMKFATYEKIDSLIRPHLDAEGFSTSFITGPPPVGMQGITVSCKLSHRGGHSEINSMPLPFDNGAGRNTLQAVGSTISYGKRYTLCAILNIIIVGEDNDGTGINALNESQVMNIETLIAEANLDPAGVSKMLEHVGFKTIGDIQQAAYRAAVNYLTAKRRRFEARQQKEQQA